MSLRLIISSNDHGRIRASGKGTFKAPLSMESVDDQRVLGEELYASM